MFYNKLLSNSSDIKYTAILFLLFCTVQGVYYWKYQGLAFSGDSASYIKYGSLLADGIWQDNYYKIYAGYLAFLAILFKVGLNLKGVVLVQIMVSATAVYCLFASLKVLTKSNFTAFIGALLFVCWPMLLGWNLFILSDSLFISFILFSLYGVVSSTKNKDHILTVVCLGVTTLIRPNGFIVLTGYLVYLLGIKLEQQRHIKPRFVLLFSAGVFALLVIVLVDHFLLSNFNFLETYPSGMIIFNSAYWAIPNENLAMPPENLTRLQQLIYFIQNNPLYFSKTAALKCLLFFSNIKPYFSVQHNLFIVMVLYPCYYFGIKGLIKSPVSRPVKWYLASVILQQGFIVTLTSEDWDGRFLMSVISYVFVLGAIGLQHTNKDKLINLFAKAPLKINT